MSSPQGRQAGSFGDELTNAALIGLVGMFGVALILRASGSVAAFLTFNLSCSINSGNQTLTRCFLIT